jgi:hypothetical protein
MAMAQYSIEGVSSEGPVNGLSERRDESVDFLAPLREIDGAVSYGVFFGISEPIHRAQSSNRFNVSGASTRQRWSERPGGKQRTAKFG